MGEGPKAREKEERKKSAEGPTIRNFENASPNVKNLRCLQCRLTKQLDVIDYLNLISSKK